MYNHLDKSKNILIVGCGGGYDIFCGLDLFFNLRKMGKKVVLGNYTFTKDSLLKEVGKKIHRFCYMVNHQSKFNEKKYISEITEDVPPKDILKQIK